eukprot:2217047-Amphidinium_carterae.1
MLSVYIDALETLCFSSVLDGIGGRKCLPCRCREGWGMPCGLLWALRGGESRYSAKAVCAGQGSESQTTLSENTQRDMRVQSEQK